ncbi:MAG: MarR family winged helix-turn-helix transcriptional regulator [Chloroflexota bacterium]|nr:MarR family winged helix-turn-helix transcriptional regulator [Chloroflexota bacterium]
MYCSFCSFIPYIRESNLSLSQVGTLFHLYYRGSSSVNDLANHLGITKAAVSQLLNPLTDAGFVLRSKTSHDRRMRLIELTEKGRLLVKESMNTRHAWLRELSKSLSESENAQLLPAIKLLNQRTRELNIEQNWLCQPDFGE